MCIRDRNIIVGIFSKIDINIFYNENKKQYYLKTLQKGNEYVIK